MQVAQMADLLCAYPMASTCSGHLADDPGKAASDAVAARIAAAMGHGKLAACESFRRER
jgi:hypothetical protein